MKKELRTYVTFSRLALVKEKVEMYDIQKRINQPDVAYKAITEITNIQEEAQEVFLIMTLNVKNEIISVHEISRGTLNGTMVHPREVFKVALLHNANSIMLFHNHPSGDPTPSLEDMNITNRLIEAGELLGIKVLDHIIIGDNYLSLKEKRVI